jgi:hypothetical protein
MQDQNKPSESPNSPHVPFAGQIDPAPPGKKGAPVAGDVEVASWPPSGHAGGVPANQPTSDTAATLNDRFWQLSSSACDRRSLLLIAHRAISELLDHHARDETEKDALKVARFGVGVLGGGTALGEGHVVQVPAAQIREFASALDKANKALLVEREESSWLIRELAGFVSNECANPGTPAQKCTGLLTRLERAEKHEGFPFPWRALDQEWLAGLFAKFRYGVDLALAEFVAELMVETGFQIDRRTLEGKGERLDDDDLNRLLRGIRHDANEPLRITVVGRIAHNVNMLLGRGLGKPWPIPERDPGVPGPIPLPTEDALPEGVIRRPG